MADLERQNEEKIGGQIDDLQKLESLAALSDLDFGKINKAEKAQKVAQVLKALKASAGRKEKLEEEDDVNSSPVKGKAEIVTTENQDISESESEPDQESEEVPPEDSAAEEPTEEEPAKEEQAPTPGGKEIAPAAAQTQALGPQPEPEQEPGEEQAPAEDQTTAPENEQDAARRLAQERRDSAAETSSASTGATEPGPASTGATDPGPASTGAETPESQKSTGRQLAAIKRMAELAGEGEEEGGGEGDWAFKMVKGWAKPLPGTLFFWWITAIDVLAIFVGEIFEASASFGYINFHAFLSLLPIKVNNFLPGLPVYEKLTWHEWFILGIIDFIVAVVVLIIVSILVILIEKIYEITQINEINLYDYKRHILL